jgi:hypothetical protein
LFLVACGGGTIGHSPTAPNWSYTVLGDSLADGVLAEQGYVERYATYVNLDTGANVDTTNLGVPGWHSSDLLNALKTDPAFRSSLTGSQVITWDIGGDDLANAHSHYTQGICGGTDNQDCLRTAVMTLEQNWSAIISQLLQIRGTSNTIIRTMDIYNPYVASDMKAGNFDKLEPYLER